MKRLEDNIVSQLWTDPNKIIEISGIVSEEDFQEKDTRAAFRVIKDSYLNKQDSITRLNAEGIKVSQFFMTEWRDIKLLAQELRRVSVTEKIKNLLTASLVKLNFTKIDNFIPEFSREFTQVSGVVKEENTGIRGVILEYEKAQNEYAQKYENGERLLGLSSGFKKIDNQIDGIRPGHFWVVGGYTSSGKTYAALNIAAELILKGKRVVFYSLEMSQTEILGRIIGIMTGLNSNKVLKGKFTPEEDARVLEAKAKLYESRLSIYSTLHDVELIKLNMLEENMKEKVDCFFLDYMQLLTSTRTDKEYDVLRHASTDFQATAKDLQIPIIALSQVSNDSVKNTNDKLIGFKGSGNIAASADLAIEIIRTDDMETANQKVKNGAPLDAIFLIKKNRHGGLGKIEMFFDTYSGKFEEKNI